MEGLEILQHAVTQGVPLGFVPILALGIPILALMIPIVAILTAHQRKMAETFRNTGAGNGQLEHLYNEVENLRREVASLKERHNDTLLALEDVRGLNTQTPPAFERPQEQTENA